MGTWRAVGDEVFAFADCCNVYALRHGDSALLIDFGSGDALDRLDDLGVERVEAVLFTHAHRDQCQGAGRAAARGIPLRFPKRARERIDPEPRPDFRRVAPGHLAYPCPFLPPQPIPAAQFDLEPAATLSFGPFDLIAFAAPGHTPEQLAFRVDGPGGASYLFCGDALHSRGKVHEPYHLETDHYTGAGARLAADTLCALRNLRAERLCPSHGPVTAEAVWDAFDATIDRLRRLADLKDTIVPRRPANRRLVRPQRDTFLQLSEHLWLWNNSYFLLADDGPVLMVDVQSVLPQSFHEQYRAAFGDRPIEVVLVSHIHCDHVMGTQELRSHHALECWAHDLLVPGIEAPYTLRRPWLHGHPTKVDRPLAEGEVVRWREYELTAHWFPGQTDLHAAYETVIDGHRAFLAGDNFYPAQQWGGTGGLCGYNGGHPALWRRSAELVLDREPDWILSSHLQPFEYRRADFETIVDWTESVAAAMRELAPDGNLERHHSPHFLAVTPYVQPAAPDLPVELAVTNTYAGPLHLAVTPRLPEGIAGESTTRELRLAPGEAGTARWALAAAPELAGMRLVTFDVTANGEPWGELAECYIRGAGSYEGL